MAAKLILTLIGTDSWDRSVYKDQYGNRWKDVSLGSPNMETLHSCWKNEFEGEPDMPMWAFKGVESFVIEDINTQFIKDIYQEDGNLSSVASCYHWLEELGWKSLSKKEYVEEISAINEDIDHKTAMLRYADVMVAMGKLGKSATFHYIEQMVDDQDELDNYNIER